MNVTLDGFFVGHGISVDNTLGIGIAAVVKICNEQKIPLFVTEPNEVERGVGIGADYYEWD